MGKKDIRPRALPFRAHCSTSLNTHFWVLCTSHLFQSHATLQSFFPCESPLSRRTPTKSPTFAAANVGPLLCRCFIAFRRGVLKWRSVPRRVQRSGTSATKLRPSTSVSVKRSLVQPSAGCSHTNRRNEGAYKEGSAFVFKSQLLFTLNVSTLAAS